MKENLIYDVGLHRGEDSDFYLRKGFRVVGFEANPELIANAKIRFQDALELRRLCLIEGAIAPDTAGRKIVFYTSPSNSVFGTIKADWVQRNEMRGYPSERIEVDRVDIVEIYRLYGIPFFLKIDIEGVDRLVLEKLKAFDERPQYVSLESEKVDFDRLVEELDLLKSLGYAKFRLVQQKSIPGTKIKTRTLDGRPFEYVFESHSSGPFGEDVPLPWLTYDEVLEQYKMVFRQYKYFGDYSLVRKMPELAQKVIHKLYRMRTGHKGPLPGWFDTHASL